MVVDGDLPDPERPVTRYNGCPMGYGDATLVRLGVNPLLQSAR